MDAVLSFLSFESIFLIIIFLLRQREYVPQHAWGWSHRDNLGEPGLAFCDVGSREQTQFIKVTNDLTVFFHTAQDPVHHGVISQLD